MTSLEVIECQCATCTGACTKRPGWFMPGQVALAAAHLGMTEKEFFDKYVGVDYYMRGDQGLPDIFVLSPATEKCQPGAEYPYDPHGICIFFKEERCSIHAVKPHECAFYDHRKDKQTCSDERDRVIAAWAENQAEIERLLGRPPYAAPPNLLDVMGLMISKLRASLPREMVEEMDRRRAIIDAEIHRRFEEDRRHDSDTGNLG